MTFVIDRIEAKGLGPLRPRIEGVGQMTSSSVSVLGRF